MQRYFIKTDQIKDQQVRITGDDVHHITTVMRGNIGDQLILCSDDKRTYLTQIAHLSKTEVTVEVVEEREENVELPVFVMIAQGIMKGDKFDLVVQKGTECGASGFVPVAMKRSVAKIEGAKRDKKVLRWQKIALEATRQAHRQIIPVVHEPTTLKQLINSAGDYDECLFAYETREAHFKSALKEVVQKLKPGMRLLILIGPEGGIDSSEVNELTTAGFHAIGLGPRILRTETAPLYVLSALSYALEIERRIEHE